jgi:dGTPase
MLIREKIEDREKNSLSPFATLASATKGRQHPEEECKVRTAFQRDRDRIIHSKAFRRLKDKTQVFISPTGDHYRTRLTHTLEVAQIARTIARALGLNEDLTEAIALGHDLGHPPFGHMGEEILNQCYPGGFKHNEQSLRVVDVLEREGKGLNLNFEVRDGILNHVIERLPETLEGQVARISDRLAYINHDIDDSIRAKVLSFSDLPQEAVKVLGHSYGERIDTLVKDTVEASSDGKSIRMSEHVAKASETIRNFMFEKVYLGSEARRKERLDRIEIFIKTLYRYLLDNPAAAGISVTGKTEMERAVCDYIAGMTDGYAIRMFQELLIPETWED